MVICGNSLDSLLFRFALVVILGTKHLMLVLPVLIINL